MGWRGKEDFQGDDDTYVDAATYIRKGEDIKASMRQHLKDNKRKMTDLERGIDDLKVHNERVFKTTLDKQQKEITELKNAKREAIEEGDAERVEEIEEEMLEKFDNMEPPPRQRRPAPDPQETQMFESWLDQNHWYGPKNGGDRGMTEYADNMANLPEYANLPYVQKLTKVTELVRKQFSNRFKGQQPLVNNSVEGARTSGGKRQFSERDLSGDQKSIMNNFVSRGIMTKKQYIKDLAAIGELG